MQISPHIISVTTEGKSSERTGLSIIQAMSWDIFLSRVIFYINTPEESEKCLFENMSQKKSESEPEAEMKNAGKKDFIEFKWQRVGVTSRNSSHLALRHLLSSAIPLQPSERGASSSRAGSQPAQQCFHKALPCWGSGRGNEQVQLRDTSLDPAVLPLRVK